MLQPLDSHIFILIAQIIIDLDSKLFTGAYKSAPIAGSA